MGQTRFKDLPFMKKILAAFLIVTLVIILGLFSLFGVSAFVSSGLFFEPGGSAINYDYEAHDGFSEGSVSNKSESFSQSSDYNSSINSSESARSSSDTFLAKDVDMRVEEKAKNIIGTIDSIREFSSSYDAVYDGSYGGSDGYGAIYLRVPSDKLDAFVTAFREKYNVVAYNNSVDNVTDDYDYIADEVAYLEEDIKYLAGCIEEAHKNGEDISAFEADIRYDRQRLWELTQRISDLDDDVSYSNVSIRVEDSDYVSEDVFDEVWYTVKVGAHNFVLAFIYGLYVVFYIFLMLILVKLLWRLFSKIAPKSVPQTANIGGVLSKGVTSGSSDDVKMEPTEEVDVKEE